MQNSAQRSFDPYIGQLGKFGRVEYLSLPLYTIWKKAPKPPSHYTTKLFSQSLKRGHGLNSFFLVRQSPVIPVKVHLLLKESRGRCGMNLNRDIGERMRWVLLHMDLQLVTLLGHEASLMDHSFVSAMRICNQ